MRTKQIVLMLLVLTATAVLLADFNYNEAKSMQIELLKERLHNSKSILSNPKHSSPRALKATEMMRQWWWYLDDEWLNADTKKYEYDYKGRVSSVTELHWDGESEEWGDYYTVSKISYLSNGEINQIIMTFIYEEEEERVEVEIMKVNHYYNERNQLTRFEVYMLDFEEMMPLMIMNVVYGNDNRAEYVIVEEHELDNEVREVVGISKSKVIYDSRGRFTEVITEYSENGGEFEKDSKTVYEYHPSDTWTYDNAQAWLNKFAYNNVLYFASSIEDDAKHLTETYYEWYDDDYYPTDRTLSVYDDDNQLIEEYYQWWAEDEEEWECEDRGLYLYREDGLVDMFIDQFYSFQEEKWMNFERYVLFYDDISSADDYTLAPLTTRAVNYPNPFNPETTISFNLPSEQIVEVAIYNSKGQLINTLISEERTPGVNNVVWNGKDVNGKPMSSGMYFYRINGETLSLKGKMLMLK